MGCCLCFSHGLFGFGFMVPGSCSVAIAVLVLPVTTYASCHLVLLSHDGYGYPPLFELLPTLTSLIILVTYVLVLFFVFRCPGASGVAFNVLGIGRRTRCSRRTLQKYTSAALNSKPPNP